MNTLQLEMYYFIIQQGMSSTLAMQTMLDVIHLFGTKQ